MSKTAIQFDPNIQFDQVLAEAEIKIAEAAAIFDRLAWLKNKLAEHCKTIEAAADAIEIMTEDEAAAALQIRPKQLAELRRRHNLPHVNFGNLIRYSKTNVADIIAILSVNTKPQPAAVRRAA